MKRFPSILLSIMLCLCLTACTAGLPLALSGDAAETTVINALDEGLCSFDGAGKDADSISGDDYALRAQVYINDGEFVREQSSAPQSYDGSSMQGAVIVAEHPDTNAVVINNTDYRIEDVTAELDTPEADGSGTCDFTGQGSALAVYGDSDVTVKNSSLKASGVACLSVFADNGASILLDGVELSSKGGTIYADYVNTPAQDTMVAPPWILGITGTSRCTNLLGERSTMTIMDSKADASNWAVFSTDMGQNMALNVINTSMELTGSDKPIQDGGKFDVANPYTSRSGYGTYVIGESTEKLLGVTMHVGTYASIFSGGSAYYGNLKAGQKYDICKADGSVHTVYEAEEDIPTVIDSDTFGFMSHQGVNECVIDGATVNSEYTDFLVKTGNDTTINIKNDARINAGNGILLQLIDSDDSTTEFDSEEFVFGETHEEYAGFPTDAVKGEKASNVTNYCVTDTELCGDIFNGTGWKANALSDENVKPMLLNVELSGDAVLEGAIASTACIHADYEGQKYLKEHSITAFTDEDEAAGFADKYQKTLFTQSEYFNIGQVANLVSYNGKNDIDVVLKDSSVWKVSGPSVISSLTVSDDAAVIVEKGATLKVGDEEFGEGTYSVSTARGVKTEEPIPIKVLILPKFEIGEVAGDYPGEAQFYYEAYLKDADEYDIEGGQEGSKLYVKDGIALYITGAGKVNAALSVNNVLTDERFDFSDALILDTGCAGTSREYGVMGDVFLISATVDGGIGHRIDSSEQMDKSRRTTWYHDPAYDDAAYRFMDEELTADVYDLIKDVEIETTEKTRNYMYTAFDGAEWAVRDPRVLMGTALTDDNYWKGEIGHANAVQIVETYDCPDPYAVTEMEDNAIAVAVDRLGLLDHLVILRDATNLDVFVNGATPENLWEEYDNYNLASDDGVESADIFQTAMENNYKVGSVIIDAYLDGTLKIGEDDKEITITSAIHPDGKYGAAEFEFSQEEFEAAGFTLGDSCDVEFENGLKLQDVPYYNGYYVNNGDPIIVATSGYPVIYITYNNIGIWDEEELKDGEKATITLSEAGKYAAIQEVFGTGYSLERSDYSSDEEFCNFRPLTGGAIKKNLLYRGASAVDGSLNRAPYTDDLIEEAGIKFIVNLSDSSDDMEEYIAEDDFSSDYAEGLYKDGKAALLDMDMDYESDEYKQKLVKGLREMIANEGPVYIHCKEGKDRTGFVSFLLEALAGATYDEMLKDYMTTYENYYDVTEDETPERYDAVKKLRFDPFAIYLHGTENEEKLKKADYTQDVAEYLMSGGMTKEEVDALKAYISIFED